MKKSTGFLLSVFVLLFMGALAFLVWPILFPKQTKPVSEIQDTQKEESAEKWVKDPNVLMKETTSTCTAALKDGTYRMYLMSERQIVYTESKDGKTFGSKNPTGITETPGKMISNPSVLQTADNDWIMIYEEQPAKKPDEKPQGPPSAKTQRNLYLATSTDGKSFKKAGIAINSSKEDKFFASVPELIKFPDGKIRMYYVSGGEAIGSAISQDNGQTWKREEGYRLGDMAVDPEVLYENGEFVMYFSTLPKPEIKNRNAIYKATSKDGLTWEGKLKVLEPENEKGFIVDPDIIKIGDKYRMFFGESTGDIGAPGAINLYMADKE